MNRFLKSFGFAYKGIRAAFATERNLKVQCVIACLTIAAGFYVGLSGLEWCIIILTIGLVLSMELINTAIENLVNLVTQEHSELAGKIKDIAAGAVLVIAGIAVAVGLTIFIPYFIRP
jgi:diacylglycerol kinase